ncbi:MAG: TlpA family protein disulfide reductase [Armatimonadetes bacterium]|nr:TlpA family protein disulfide reductase [Armatimonadota bacterium]
MKRITSLLLALAISSAAHAAPAPRVAKAAAHNHIDPAAIALLDEAIAAYKTDNGLMMKFESNFATTKRSRKSSGVLHWKAPNLLRVEESMGNSNRIMVSDGQAFFTSYNPQRFRRVSLEKMPSDFVANMAGTASDASFGEILASLLSGKNSLLETRKATLGLEGGSYRAERLAPILLNGVSSEGLRLTSRLDFGGKPMMIETTAWFDAKTRLLRRVQSIVQLPTARSVSVTTISETDLNPAFAPATFVWSPLPGAKELKEDEEEDYFDPKLKVGITPHPLTGVALDGKPRSIAGYRGKVVLIDFWATWCGPCVAEIPTVLNNYQKYKAQGFDVLGVSLDEDKKALTDFVKARKLPWPQLFDGKGWKTANATRYGVRGIPFTLLIGRDGKIAAVNPRGPQLEKAIQKALK